MILSLVDLLLDKLCHLDFSNLPLAQDEEMSPGKSWVPAMKAHGSYFFVVVEMYRIVILKDTERY